MDMRHAELKAERAFEHLQALEVELEAYYHNSPWSVRRYDDSERGRHIIKIWLKDPSDRIYILAGDFAHCLRCTLDHIVYALVTNGAGKLPTGAQIMWPVLEAPNPDKLKQRTRGMAPVASQLIEQLQPYHFGKTKENPIWQLTKLDNIDKHRYLAIHETALDMHFPQLRNTDDVVRNAEASEISLPLEHSKTEMLLNPRPAVWFGAASENLRVDAKRLGEIYSYIRMQVLPLFAPLFIRAIA
jgi:hypothetical protein